MLEAYKSYWKNCFNFKARTSRKNYWLAFLATFIVSFILGVLLSLIFHENIDVTSIKTMDELIEAMKHPSGIINIVWILVNFIPQLALDIRRLHDTNKSAWHILINAIPVIGSIIFLVWMCSKSVDKNKYASQV